MLNKKRLQKVIDLIQKTPSCTVDMKWVFNEKPSSKDLFDGFGKNGCQTTYGCQTTCCIAGFTLTAMALENKKYLAQWYALDENNAAKWLGLTGTEAASLFFPEGQEWTTRKRGTSPMHLRGRTGKTAVLKELHYLLETGKV